MRDEQVRRYARHILLPDFGGLGQTSLMVAGAIVDMRDRDLAAAICARYLVAGGVGTVVLRGATDAQVAALSTYGPDTKLIATDKAAEIPDHARVVPIPPAPPWWHPVDGDDTALAFWRGGLAASQWMAAVGNR
jgi:molybdopterin-synthase adenylyltransferase